LIAGRGRVRAGAARLAVAETMFRRRGAEPAIAHADRRGRNRGDRRRADAAAATTTAAGGPAATAAAGDVAAAAARVHAAAGARGRAAAAVTPRAGATAAIGPPLGERRPRGEQESRYGHRKRLSESLHIMRPQRR
jgi:hypothetical protein